MSAFDWNQAVERAGKRLAKRVRSARSDRGRARCAPRVEAELQRLLSTPEKPNLVAVARSLKATCQRWGEPAPSRATLYNALARVPSPRYPVESLPAAVRDTLLNVDAREISAEQLVYCAFNYGSLAALSFASGLPWLCLLRASKLRGFRPKSHALLRAVMSYRGIE